MMKTEPRRNISVKGKIRVCSLVETDLERFPDFHDDRDETGFFVGGRN
jgi:hypothetical protein